MTTRDHDPDGIDGIDEALALVAAGPAAAPGPVGRSGPARGADRSDGGDESGGTDQERGDHGGASGATAAPSASAAGPAHGASGGRAASGRHRAEPWETARAIAVRSGRSARRASAAPTDRVPLDRALGRALAEPLAALTDLPSFDTSAMDGWAVSGPGPWAVRSAHGASARSASDGPAEDNGILAGKGEAAPLPDGAAVRIATGARIPPEATAVVRSEHARIDGGHLHAEREVVPGQDIRPRGQECGSGDRLLPAGSLVTPAVLGLAAAAGYDELLTVPRPRVEILVLGDELLNEGLPHDGLIRDALGPMIAPWIRSLGAEVLATRRIGDDADALCHAITGSVADLVITTGGTASGPVDHVHPVLRKTGAELLVDGVAVRPGHPMLLARLASGHHLVGLPGNPLAAVSGLLTLAEPLLRSLAGRAPRIPYRTPLRDLVQGHPSDTRLVPVVHRDEGLVPLHFNGPAMLRGIAAADGLVVVPPGGARAGQELEVLDLPWTAGAEGGCFT
ncbi:molybdopterin molybdotransferase MoeA [Streptomyces lushanensis]|uniref:molybdopterin molybdotransferase MoeA n=1 Tax=Streptomyces lushanensis TaxID=1434255 RepID=UPI00082E3CEF|nr:molybdopterin molybdotransferase MoeA [Streptomyces lushanensis]